MSFLETEEDKSLLNEALAFIDACEGDSSPVGTTDDSDVPSLDGLLEGSSLGVVSTPAAIEELKADGSTSTPVAVQPANCKGEKTKSKATKKRRVRSAETSSTGLQRRKRAELVTLREQVEELGSVLTQLRRTGGHALSSDAVYALNDVDNATPAILSRSQWQNHAIDQYRLRLQAEKVNRQLKTIMKNQTKVREALSGVLQKRSVLYGMDYLMKYENPKPSGMMFVDFPMTYLEDTTERLCLLSSSIFEIQHRPISAHTSMQCKYDECRKTKTIEFETTTELNCSLQEAGDLLWRDFQSDRTLGTKPDTLSKRTILTMPSRNGAIVAEKLHFMRKYQDNSQMLVTWADIMVLPTKRDLQFRTEGLVLLSPSTTRPEQTSVSRSFLKLYLDVNNANDGVRPEDVAYGQDIVLGAMATKLRKYWNSFQDMLIDGTNHVSQHAITV